MMPARRVRRMVRAGALLALAAALGGCFPHGAAAPARPAPEELPSGSPLRSLSLADSDAWLRHHLMFGEYPRAIEALARGSALAPADRLLRALQEAVVLHEAGEHERSNRVLEWAEVEADRRYTRSLSRAAGALAVNDGIMAYTPTAGELTMVPYYRMLNYLALGDQDGALVEARKANALYARLRRKPRERCHEDGMVQYLAGLVQRSAGELNDALVSLRQAAAAFDACPAGSAAMPEAVALDLHRAALAAGMPELADSAAARYGLQPDTAAAEPSGELLLLLEQGFVAHRAEEALHVPILTGDVEGLKEGDDAGVAAAAARIGGRILNNLAERATWGKSADDHPLSQWAHAMGGTYVMRLAWPTLRLEASRPAGVRVWVGDSLAASPVVGDLSAVVGYELAERRPAILARMVARGVTKYLVSRGVEEAAEEKGGEVAKFVLGRIANLAANQLEQADTRSWSLLPDRIAMSRLRLPAGTHRIRVEVVGPDGELQTRELGTVQVAPGRLAVLSERLLGGERGELPPFPVPAPADSSVAASDR